MPRDYQHEAFAEHNRNLAIHQWMKERVENIHNNVSAYDVLRYHGVSLRRSESQEEQISCPFHGKDLRPSARYYPKSRNGLSCVWCFVCQEKWDAISLWKKFNGETKFSELLYHIEKAFGIQPPTKEHIPDIEIEDEYDALQVKVDSLLEACENRLREERDHFELKTFLKLGTILDQLHYRIEKENFPLEKAKLHLSQLLNKIGEKIRASTSVSSKS